MYICLIYRHLPRTVVNNVNDPSINQWEKDKPCYCMICVEETDAILDEKIRPISPTNISYYPQLFNLFFCCIQRIQRSSWSNWQQLHLHEVLRASAVSHQHLTLRDCFQVAAAHSVTRPLGVPME